MRLIIEIPVDAKVMSVEDKENEIMKKNLNFRNYMILALSLLGESCARVAGVCDAVKVTMAGSVRQGRRFGLIADDQQSAEAVKASALAVESVRYIGQMTKEWFEDAAKVASYVVKDAVIKSADAADLTVVKQENHFVDDFGTAIQKAYEPMVDENEIKLFLNVVPVHV